MIRVLISDDSPTARTLIAQILSSDPEIQIIGEARDGLEAVKMTESLRPDLVTMDIRMPKMDGFQATKEIMTIAPTPIVIVSASRHTRDIQTTMQALQAGALTVLDKPIGPDSPHFAERAQQLVSTVKAMSQVKVVRHHRVAPRIEARPRPVRTGTRRARIVAIATSTGGPAALQSVLSELPTDFSVPILVVQHISHGFTLGLAAWLKTVCPLRVKVAEEGEHLAPGTVYIGPEDQHLGVTSRSTIALSTAPPIGGFRPSGTYLFESVAKHFGGSMVAVILTGMGEDGVLGLRAVREAGGQVIAQDEQSSIVFGMPGAAVKAGLVDDVLPLSEIASRLKEFV